ncbi:MAG: taurine transport system substrate-binding protein [Gammaproteobacteria bacterium]|nr:taurine transport system substrate-binding protein [Gammaproteobacteria bacterium]
MDTPQTSFAAIALLCLTLIFPRVGLSADALHVGYVTGVEPAKAGIVDGSFDRTTGRRVEWRRFDNGAEVVRALASGDLDIANLGSSVVAVAAGRQLPIETFLIASQLGASEALVARNGSGIKSPGELKGKTIAVPFVTTAHYSLLAALKHWGLDKNSVHVINLRISEIPAAWQGGNIDAAYVFDPALGRIKETGTVLATSTDVANWGAPTFDVWVVRKEFSARNPAVVAAFARAALEHMQSYRTDPVKFVADAANIDRLARATGAKATDVPSLLAGNQYPVASEQRALLGGSYVRAIADTAAFLKSLGKVDTVLADYQTYSTARFLP